MVVDAFVARKKNTLTYTTNCSQYLLANSRELMGIRVFTF